MRCLRAIVIAPLTLASSSALAILVFPKDTKAGFGIGGQKGLMAGLAIQGNKITKKDLK